MPKLPLIPRERIVEAERLIRQAQTLLDRPEEEIVVNYLEHAVEALRIVAEQPATNAAGLGGNETLIVPAMPRAGGLG